jgi:hypothetical protein
MNTKNKQDQKKKQRHETQVAHGVKKRGQQLNTAHESVKYQEHELPEMRLTR